MRVLFRRAPAPNVGGSPRLSRLLRLAIALQPPSWRRRFADDVVDVHRELGTEDPRLARRFVLDLLANAPGTHLDGWRLSFRRLGAARRDPGSRPASMASPPPPTAPRPEASMLDILSRDFHLALRRLGRQPLVSLLAVTTLALGIGGTTAMFSVVNGVLLEPLSSPHTDRLVNVFESSERSSQMWLAYDSFLDYRDRAESLEHLAVARPQSVTVHDTAATPERIRGLFVSSTFFDALGESPSLGRAIRPGEDQPGGERTAVLSHGFWQRRYGGDEGVLGRTVKLNNEPHTIVGVMSPDFRFPFDTTEAWISLHTFPGTLNRTNRTLFVVGRLAEGRTLEEAGEELRVLAAGLAASHPESHDGVSAGLLPLTEIFAGGRSRELFAILAAAVAMVLLIAAANVANLQLAQATGRGREMVLRTAVGAGRRRLVAQLLIENLVLAVVGGALGVGVAYGGIRLLLQSGPSWLTGLYSLDPDPKVLAFALGISLLTGLAFGLVPARRASRVNLTEGLRDGGRGSGPGHQGARLRASLVVAQVALAVVLVVGAGLLLRSVRNMASTEVGFDTRSLLTVQFRLPANKYDSDEKVIAYFDQALERVRAVPGVTGTASALGMPFTGDEPRMPVLADGVDPGQGVEVPSIRMNVVSPGYFQTMGIPLLAGRAFDERDRATGTPVAIVSRQAADQLWPGQAATGRTVGLRGQETVYQVVGVVGDIYNRGMRSGLDPMVYLTYLQEPTRFATIAARTTPDPHSLSQAIRDAIWQIDAEQPLWEVMTQEERIAGWSGSDRFLTSLVGVFAAVALTLAAVGIGGVIAYTVALRRRELGVRICLGADRLRIARHVLGQGLRLVGLGVALGLTGAIATSNALGSWLYGVESFDAAIFLAAPLILALVALVSILWPALRAAGVDPVVALEED
ncbi:MAG: ABC transporter permease [Holophagales bacterium]|nr:ABC transporter permease [Holophagales bacterium]